MLYQKREGGQGAWIKAKDLQEGTKAKLVSETTPQESVFEGKPRTQNVAKIRIQDKEGVFNIGLNQTTINGLIDAFGGDSKQWVDKTLTVKTDKTTIGGRRVTVLYLLAEGYDLLEDSNSYLYIGREGTQVKKNDDISNEEIPF